MDTVRVGIVGAGFMAKTHSLAYRAAGLLFAGELPRIEQTRIADIASSSAHAAAAAFGWRDATDDWRDITRADDIDVVDIVTPNNTHAEIAIDAADHGKHVLCEKPLATTVEDARRMEEAAATAGVLTQVGFVYRMWPATALARQLIDDGTIGEIRQIRAHYFHDYALDPDFSMGWRTERAVSGAGSLGDLGSHVIDIARYLVGEITAVNATTRTIVARRPSPDGSRTLPVDVEDAADALLEFACGATGVVQTNWMAAGHKTDIAFEITGEHGAVSFTWERSNELRLYSDKDSRAVRGFRTVHLGPLHPGAERFWPVAGQGLGYGDAFTILIARFLASVGAGTAAGPTFADGLAAAEAIDAALRSSTTRQWTNIRPPRLVTS